MIFIIYITVIATELLAVGGADHLNLNALSAIESDLVKRIFRKFDVQLANHNSSNVSKIIMG